MSRVKRFAVVCVMLSLLTACTGSDGANGDQRQEDVEKCVYDAVLAYPGSDPRKKLTLEVPSCASLDEKDRLLVANHLADFTEEGLTRLSSPPPA